jgi:hypothetical protein
MGRAYRTNGEEEKCIYIGYWWESQKERDHYEDQERPRARWVDNIKMDLR